MSNKFKKQIPQESFSRSFLVIIFTHFQTPSLLMVFTLIVLLSMMIQEYPNVLHLFLMSKRNLLLKESDSFINTEFSLLNPRSVVFLSFRLYLLANRASHDSLSINFTMMSPFFVLCDTSILVFLILWMYLAHFIQNIGAVLRLCQRYSRDFKHLPHPILFKLVSLNLL